MPMKRTMENKTRWNEFYSEAPALYDELARAEDRKNLILDRITSRRCFGGDVVLDIGAGSCKYSMMFAKLSKEVIALEPSRELLSVARESLSKSAASNVRILEGVVEDIPLEDSSIDSVVSAWAFLHDNINLDRAVSETFRVLKPGGEVFIIEADCTGELVSMLERSGHLHASSGFRARHEELLRLHDFDVDRLTVSFEFDAPAVAERAMSFVFGKSFGDILMKQSRSRIDKDVIIFHAVNNDRKGIKV